MKKAIFLVLVTVMALAGCNKDENVKQDPIVGKWHYSARVELKNGEEYYRELATDCEKKSYWKFETDGSGLIAQYYYGKDKVCSSDEPTLFTWVSKGNNLYALTVGDTTVSTKIIVEDKKMKFSHIEIEGEVEYTKIDVYTLVE